MARRRWGNDNSSSSSSSPHSADKASFSPHWEGGCGRTQEKEEPRTLALKVCVGTWTNTFVGMSL